MDLTQLRKRLDDLSECLANSNRKLLNIRLATLSSVFPFNEYEYVLMFLLDKGAITFDQYEKLRKRYVSSNNEVGACPHRSHQHRGGIEYQIGINHRNLADFDIYQVTASLLGDKVLEKAQN